MGLETFDLIKDLIEENPVSASDNVAQGADHLRGIKETLLNQFTSLEAPVTRTAADINSLSTLVGTETLRNKTLVEPIIEGGLGGFFSTYSCSDIGAISDNPTGWTITKGATGIYTLNHGLNLTNATAQMVMVTSVDVTAGQVIAAITIRDANSITYFLDDNTGTSVDADHVVMFSNGGVA